MSITLNASEQQVHHSLNSIKLELSQQWQFCPTDNFQPGIDSSQLKCHEISIPGPWETVVENYNGYGLLKTHFRLPTVLQNKHLAIYFSHIRDADKVYVNDILVGETGEFPPNFQKAVFYSRLYAIPLNIIKPKQENTLSVWVYNDARPGGIFSTVPTIASYESEIQSQHKLNYITFALIVILFAFSLFNFINFIFNLKSLENLYFGLFLFCWSIYIFTSSDLVLLTNLPLNMVFRANIILFFLIFCLFMLFIYAFFKQTVPLIVKLMIATTLMFIPMCVLLPQPGQLYLFVIIVELISIPSALFLILLLIKANKSKLAYAGIMTVALTLYMLFGVNEIIMDVISANEAASYSPLGPWLLIIISIALMLIVSHKNLSYYKKATFDGLTGILRFENFKDRLNRLIARVQREKKALLVLMVDLDDFKQVNDKYGHMQGDKVLILLSDIMRNEMSHFDLLARYGGDEFCIAVMMDKKNELSLFAQELHQTLNALTIDFDDATIAIKTTIGAVIIDHKKTTITAVDLINQADEILIKAKVTNKGNILW